MTRLFLNNEEVLAPPPSFSSLDQIIKHVEDNLLPPNTVIRQVSLDGLPVDAVSCQSESTALLGDLTQRERVEIFTCPIREVAIDSLREAGLYLERVEALTPSLAAIFRDFPGPEAFESLKQLYEGFYWMSRLLGRLESVFRINLDQMGVEGTPIRKHHQKFILILKQLVGAQEQEDFILVADLLEFEVIPIVPVWKALFADIAKQAGDTE